jgi:lipoprotein NlpD
LNYSLPKIISAIFKQFDNFKLNLKFNAVCAIFIIVTTQGCGSHIYHFVEPGETLYSISWAYGHDFREVATWNDIPPPYVVKRGQKLRVAELVRPAQTPKKGNKNSTVAIIANAGKDQNTKADTQVSSNRAPDVSRAQKLAWRWPIKDGKIIQTFDAGNPAKQGVDVTGKFGQPVYSAEAGRVVYSGGGLNHYGKLIIVKHNETFLSAYAHNKRLLVKEGDVLKSGQRIAEMGSTGTNTTKLHFEIRRNGKPVNPLHYLPRR